MVQFRKRKSDGQSFPLVNNNKIRANNPSNDVGGFRLGKGTRVPNLLNDPKDEELLKKHLELAREKSKLDSVGNLVRVGEWIGGQRWGSYDSVTINGLEFNTETKYIWDNSDFPQDEDVNDAIELVKKHNLKENDDLDPEKDWVDFLDQLEQEGRAFFVFKVTSFIVEPDGDVSAFPDDSVSLGRVPVKELEKVGSMG